MPFWSGQTLAEKLPNIISGFDPSRIDCAAYTLAMGPQFYVTRGNINFDPRSSVVEELEHGKHFRIQSGQFAFLLTEESIKVPADAVAFISMKSKYKWRGLVNVSGFHVDPGFQGRLIFAVYNAGPSEIQIQRGDQLFLIWFCDLDAESEAAYRKSYNEKVRPQDSIPSDLAAVVAGHIYSPITLIEDTRQNRALLDRINWIGRIFASIVITLVLAAATVVFKGFEVHEARISRIEDRLMSVKSKTFEPIPKNALPAPTNDANAPINNSKSEKQSPK